MGVLPERPVSRAEKKSTSTVDGFNALPKLSDPPTKGQPAPTKVNQFFDK